MLMRHLSMRTSLGITIVAMGLLGLGLALATGEIYRQQTLDNQRVAMVDLLKLKINDQFLDFESKARELGVSVQSDKEFQLAFDAHDGDRLARLLDNQFHQYFETAHVMELQKLQVLDLNFNVIGESTEGSPDLPAGRLVCPRLAGLGLARHGAERLKPLAELCLVGKKPYHAVIVPIGGLRPRGYIQVVINPVYCLSGIETILGIPLRLTLPDGVVAHQSTGWSLPAAETADKTLIAEYILKTSAAEPLMTVALLEDISLLYEKLTRTRFAVMLTAGLILVVVIFFASLLLQKMALRPLMALHDQMRMVRKDRTRLGETLTPAGTGELRELSQDFNAMCMELRDLHHVLEHMAFTDALTGLPNRTSFQRHLQKYTPAGPRAGAPFALFMMDLDRFKEVNDTFGHDVGDQLLKQVSARLGGVLHRSEANPFQEEKTVPGLDNEIIARMGGDEFAAIMPNVGEASLATTMAQRFVEAMEQPFLIGSQRFHVGVSVGVVLYPQHGTDPTVLLRQADIAMYEAKQNRHGYTFFDSKRDQHKLEQMTFERDLRQAIENDRLELHYQPIVDIGKQRVGCLEALVRWRYPEQEFVAADKVIRAAEQSGLIEPLTRWVLNRAAKQCMGWRKSGFQVDVSVNISAVNLHEPDFVDYVADTLRRWGMESSWLSLELTESAVMSNPSHAFEVLSRLDAMGVRISIDDFGTGYSSLAYLRQLPVDAIKIDKAFVIDMKQDGNDAVIVRSTIDLAHNMNLHVVAEGVENIETLDLLDALGCDKAQGYFISRPLSYDDLLLWLDKSAWKAKSPPVAVPARRRKTRSARLRHPHSGTSR
jgi:diguanylate cyclase (GGDEF)-like protein